MWRVVKSLVQKLKPYKKFFSKSGALENFNSKSDTFQNI